MSFCKPKFHKRKIGPRGVGGFTPVDVAKMYNFPRINTPTRQVPIGIIELGGGYKISNTLAAFKLWNLPLPTLETLNVMGGTNSPGDDADGEVELDIQIACAVYSYCTGQAAHAIVAFAPNSDAGFAGAIQALVKAGVSVISISWGAAESAWSSSAVSAMEAQISNAVKLGIPVLAASGDADAGDGSTSFNVDYPASSPGSIGCGGTTRSSDGAEVVWNDGNGSGTGGGFSRKFSRPIWQLVSGNARGVPDVAGDADPSTGYQVWIDGSPQVVGGTSCVSPLYSGLFAACAAFLTAQARGPLGNVLPLLYSNPSVFRDITQGNNSGFPAGKGWDAASGLGVVDGTKLFDLLAKGVVVPPPPVTLPTITLSSDLRAGTYSLVSAAQPKVLTGPHLDLLALPGELLSVVEQAVKWGATIQQALTFTMAALSAVEEWAQKGSPTASGVAGMLPVSSMEIGQNLTFSQILLLVQQILSILGKGSVSQAA